MLSVIKYILTVVDILVVAYIFYKAFMLIRGTRAVQALKGLGILIAISSIASFGRLQTLDWLLRKFWTWGAVAFIILFAPELKRALARMGRTAAFLGGNFPDEQEHIQSVVEASERLSALRAGALIVMSREADLDEFAESGIYMDSQVSRELLMTIFYPDTELHDGAVIVRNGRIIAASCTLPLSQNRRWEQSLGTRHRAGIGLTEETDAVVVIVSEETGVISVAMDGEITRYLDPQTLHKVLIDLLVPESVEPEVVPEITTDENTQNIR
jgi:diadenylate cyclase